MLMKVVSIGSKEFTQELGLAGEACIPKKTPLKNREKLAAEGIYSGVGQLKIFEAISWKKTEH